MMKSWRLLPNTAERMQPSRLGATQAEDYLREVRAERLTDGRRNGSMIHPDANYRIT